MSRVATERISKNQNFMKTRYIPYNVFIKKYSIGAQICKGGFGAVYAAFNTRNNQPVAVKHIVAENVCCWDLLNGRQMPIEIALLAKCQSVPGVIRMHHYTCQNNEYLIAMERVPTGMDLFEFNIQHGPISESVARNFFRQIVEILQACAKQGVVHLDIKLENIIVDAITGKIKLIDFGSGAWLSKIPLKNFTGTWLYAAPEWFLYREYDAIAATVWSLGVLLYTMLMDKYPFSTRFEISNNILQWESQVSFGCQELIANCLASKPEDRPMLENILCHSWLFEHESNEWKCNSLRTIDSQEIALTA